MMPRIIIDGQIKSISIMQILAFILCTLIGVILSLPFHEFGHCIFYWIQGIPAAMSMTKEFPLRNISVNQYAFGSFGGILFTWLATILFFSLQNYFTRKNRKGKTIVQALFLGQSMLGFIYMLQLILKGDKGELLFIENSLHLPLNSLALFTFILALTLLIFFLRKLRIKIGFQEIVFFFLLFLLSIISVSMIGELDKNLFWRKFPAIKIGDVKTYNEPLPKLRIE